MSPEDHHNDALLTQKDFCQTLREKKADYVLPVKANQLTYQDIQCLFEPESPHPQAYQARIFETLHHEAKAHTDTASTVEKAHGYITTRTLLSTNLGRDLASQAYTHPAVGITSLCQIGQLRRENLRSHTHASGRGCLTGAMWQHSTSLAALRNTVLTLPYLSIYTHS